MEVAVKSKAKRRHVNSQECSELSAEAINPLTQPHSFNPSRGNQDPNRGLYPTKRRKWVAPLVPNEEEEDDEDSDAMLLAAETSFKQEDAEVDDATMLAAVMMPKPEELDDDSLLAAGVIPGPQAEAVDYLEGMTPEMFGCDDDWSEPLPDAHYGLLGTSSVLLQPQGCMDNLPEEVLMEVLSLLPAHDLYRSAIRVCHRWKNIIQDSKFVPFKKQYYRYMLREKDTMPEVFYILRSSRIIDAASSHHSIRQLVILMAQHKVGERVWPGDVLNCVKKHRLFPQAEASIRLRIPHIQKHLNLGIEGPNPYAAMAVILILSESVGDVQALVSLLTSCLSHTAITEYLSRMAMLLLAFQRGKIRISHRSYYNIYYVLHLMENGPFPIQLTGEQQHILSHDIQKDQVVKIIAFAGTGKTTTLVKYAEQRPDLRFLYVAFNRYQACGKLTSNLKAFTINTVLPKGRGGFTKAKVVATTLNTFMASTDPTITTRHVPSSHVTHKNSRTEICEAEKRLFVHDAEMIWNKMKDYNETKNDAYHMIHDGYLKLWQLQNPKPRLSDKYDAIFIDEAQDCTPAIMDVMLSQHCGKILVGDPHQQIYTFKGAVNALQVVDHTHIFYLTQSFRFGAEIAYVGATILKVCKRVERSCRRETEGVCDETAVKVTKDVWSGVSPCRGKTAILSRCNLTVFSNAVQLTDANPHCRIHFIGEVQNIGLHRIMDLWQLKKVAGQTDPPPSDIKDPLIRSFAKNPEHGFWALKEYANQTEDLELTGKLNIVEKYNHRIPELVRRLRSCSENEMHKADFIVGTVHKAKGLEFDTVMVTDDFSEVPGCRHEMRHHSNFSFSRVPDDEWNLLYVAVTRARRSLIITRNIHNILSMDGEYFLKSQMPNTLMKAGEPLPCSVTNCPNCITPGSAFIMCARQMEYTFGTSAAGPLCERCVWERIGPTAFLMTDDVFSMAAIPERFDPPDHAFF
ncbi:hypothetical protein INR49_004119 [Caranx melampygus]|nr:hypothetical protein INR49_004119 [Caranx melampygus]